MKTLRAIWSSIKVGRNALLRPNERNDQVIGRVLFGPYVDSYADILYRSLTPEAIQVMRNGRFNPRDLVAQLQPVGSQFNSRVACGTYILFFGDINHGFSRLVDRNNPPSDAIYAGQTVDYPDRLSRHMAVMESERDSNIYRVGRTSPEHMRNMLPFFTFRPDDPAIVEQGLTQILNIAELTQVCLFQSWVPLLTRQAPSTGTGGHILHYEHASTFANMMKLVCQTTGWDPSPTVGLNWQTPVLSQSKLEREWIVWYDYQRSSYIYRSSHQVLVYNANRSTQVNIHWGSDPRLISLPVEVQAMAEFESGDPVTLMVEIKHDTQRYLDHPVPYIRVPRPCHNEEFEKLRSMSVQLQWLHRATGQWKGVVLQLKNVRNQTQGEFNFLKAGMILFSTLTQTTYRQAPQWWPNADRTIVRHLKMDHLQQKAWLPANQIAGKIKDWPRNFTVQENADRLRRSIPQDLVSDVAIGARPAAAGGARCDLCKSLVDVSYFSPCIMVTRQANGSF